MKTSAKILALVGVAALFVTVSVPAQVASVEIGAVSTNAGSKLAFLNAASIASGSGYAVPLVYQAWTNRYPATNRLYSTTNLLFTAVSTRTNPAGAASGAYLVCEVRSVTGPAGGVLSFWEQGAYWPTYNFPVGGVFVSGQNRFMVSDIVRGAGLPDGDPYGAIPRRRFSVNQPGEYVVTFKLFDTSENHPTLTGTPIHAPSDTLSIKFVAGVDLNITRFVKTNNVATLTFTQSGLTNMFVDRSTNLADWSPVAGPFADSPLYTNTTTRSFTNDPAISSVFYRLRGAKP